MRDQLLCRAHAHLCRLTGMNVIRMIKLFGWEPRVAQRLADKRESELVFIRKYKILELINNNIKFVSNAPGLLVQ